LPSPTPLDLAISRDGYEYFPPLPRLPRPLRALSALFYFGGFYLFLRYFASQAAATSEEAADQIAVAHTFVRLVTTYWPAFGGTCVFLSALIAFGWNRRALIFGGVLGLLVFFTFLSSVNKLLEKYPKYAAIKAGEAVLEPASKLIITPSAPAGTAAQRAIQAYPELGIANSPLNKEFLRRHKSYEASNPKFFSEPEWPTKLARESAEALKKADAKP
jgi:hypothetical protein